jgi:dipeptidyl aminopeptidase/acylaminoacyl peptidase
VARDVVTGAERTVFRKRAAENGLSLVLSPDGRSIATVEHGAGGAQTRPRRRGRQGRPWPDRRRQGALAHSSRHRSAAHAGRGHQHLVFGDGNYRFGPDGRRIAFVTHLGKKGAEVWALENILPDSVTSR